MQFVLAAKSKEESFASLCRSFGISRNSGYKWLKRYRLGGVKALQDASRRPRHPGKKYHFYWRERLHRARRARPDWGAKKLRWRLKKAFPRAKRIPGVSTLARWLAEGNFVKKRKRRARPGPVLPGRGVRAVKSCNQVWTIDLRRLVSHWRRTTLRAADGARFAQPLYFGRSIVEQPKRRGSAPSLDPDFSPLRFAQSHSRRQWSALWRQWSFGTVAFERVVAAAGHYRRVYPASASAGQRRARTNASDLQSRCGGSPCARAAKHRNDASEPGSAGTITSGRHEALGQQVPAQIYWPSSRPMPSRLEESRNIQLVGKCGGCAIVGISNGKGVSALLDEPLSASW